MTATGPAVELPAVELPAAAQPATERPAVEQHAPEQPATDLLTAAEVASVRRPYRAASLLPGRAYHDERFLDFERREFFRRDWVMVGRAEEVPEAGSYKLTEIDGEPIVIVRGRDDVVRAFYNVCRHRGTAVVEEPRGKVVRFQCPYHAWIYDFEGRLVRAKHTDDLDDFSTEAYGLRPVRLERWQGFLFVSLVEEGPSLRDQLGDLVDHFARFDLASLRVAHSVTYEAGANWKFVAENYSECYHCPGVHPQLNRLTPYDLGGDFEPNGEWQGGWMELVGDAETMALQGGHRNGRPAMAGATADDERRITYYLVWPSVFLSIHPDYLLVHRLIPTGAGQTTIECQWLFEPATMARPDFDPSDAIAFWDLTNRQDWHVCELQQRGTGSSSWTAGRYSSIEPSVHAFDLMVTDRYAADGVVSGRTVRERYDLPVPPDDDAGPTPGSVNAPAVPTDSRRSAVRSVATRR
jgi:Rieske 2Fe-2S family protein